MNTDEMPQGNIAGASRHFIATNTNHNVWLMGQAGQQQALDGDSGHPPRLTVHNGMLGMCPAGCVDGQAAQPGSTRTPSSSVQLGALGWSQHCCTAQLGGDAQHVGTDTRARPSNCAETLKSGDEKPLVIGHHSAEPSNLVGTLC
jgi:hypothetical protein